MKKTKQSSSTNGTPLLYDDHRPVTRRQFLGQGLVSGAALLTAPSLLGLLGTSSQARAQALDCGISVGGTGKIPFICFDLAGGASIAGSNVMVGGAGGQQDFLTEEGYRKLGLPSDMLPQLQGQLNTELGLAFHADSAILRGILDKTSAATRAATNGAVFCARSANDTENNPHNPMFGINKAGADGDLVTLIGTKSTLSGGRSEAPESMIDVSVKPTRISRPEDALGLVDTGKLVDLLNQQDASRVMQAIERISALKINQLSESQIIKDLLTCGYVQSTSLVSRYSDPGLLDPRLDSAITAIFSEAQLDRSDFRKTASIMKLVLNGFAGAGTIELGGYDYHNSTRSKGESEDFVAGQAIGACLEYAAQLGQPLMLYVFSDGSVASNGQFDDTPEGRGKLIWKGDNSSTASVFTLVYNPNGRPALTSPDNQQIGFFRPDGSLETAASPISNNVEQLAEAIVLNYLALHDDTGRFSQVLPGNGLPASTLDSLIAFQPIV